MVRRGVHTHGAKIFVSDSLAIEIYLRSALWFKKSELIPNTKAAHDAAVDHQLPNATVRSDYRNQLRIRSSQRLIVTIGFSEGG